MIPTGNAPLRDFMKYSVHYKSFLYCIALYLQVTYIKPNSREYWITYD